MILFDGLKSLSERIFICFGMPFGAKKTILSGPKKAKKKFGGC